MVKLGFMHVTEKYTFNKHCIINILKMEESSQYGNNFSFHKFSPSHNKLRCTYSKSDPTLGTSVLLFLPAIKITSYGHLEEVKSQTGSPCFVTFIQYHIAIGFICQCVNQSLEIFFTLSRLSTDNSFSMFLL